MNVREASELMEKYAKCPECGCEVIGNGKGTLEIDKGIFKRACYCGWSIVIDKRSTT